MPFDRAGIFARFPWLQQSELSMVIGDDLDALLSALVLHHAMGWKVVGLYQEYTTILYQGDASTFRDAVWVDLDISQPTIRSIGHHILYDRPGQDESSHSLNLNLNRLRGVTGAMGRCTTKGEACGCGSNTFRHKYPLGTAHFLLWLYDVKTPDIEWLDALWWHADSTWINGQSHKYAPNVKDWVQNYVAPTTLARRLNQIDSRGWEQSVAERVIPFLQQFGFQHGRSQTRSRHLSISNWQCQFQSLAAISPDINGFWSAVGRECQLTPPRVLPGPWTRIKGLRRSGLLDATVAADGGLPEFIRNKGVFSYVIPNGGRINWTSGIVAP
ncbi:MAG: hypothetical protein KF768_14525 [Phycisphaeraceae bacterium]|nr:hypothetical protein [Phycisphaeraceae bacterium]